MNIVGNYSLGKALEEHSQNRLVKEKSHKEVKEKASIAIKDGLFSHHVSFAFEKDGFVYYKEYFAKGWKKRKPNKDGWIKYLNSLCYNVLDGRMLARSDIKNF